MAEAIDHIDALKQTKDGHLTSDEIIRMKAIIQFLDAKGVFDANDAKASIEKIESEFLKIQGATRNKLEELKFFINSDVKVANKLILTPQETAVIQKEYGVDPIDGVPGFHTWVAIIRIQKKYGKVMDGVMGKETQDALVRDATKNSVVRIKGTSEVKDAMPYKQDATKGLFNVLADQFQKLPFPNTELLKSFPNDLFSKIDAILQNKNIPGNVMHRFVRDLQRYHADIRSITPEEIDKHVKITNVPDWKPVDSVHTLIYTRLTQPILLMIQDMQMAYIDPHIKLGNDSVSYHKGKYEELTGGLQGLDKKYGISVVKGMETMFSNEKRDIRGIDWDGSIGRSICSQLESQGYTFGDSNYVKSISGAPLNRGNMREKDTKIFKDGKLLLDSANKPVDIIEVIIAYRGAMNQWRGSEGEIRAFRAQSKDTPSALGKILSPDAKELVMDHQFNTLPPKLVLQQMTAIEKELLFDGLKELAPFFGDFNQILRLSSEIRHGMDAKGEVVYWNGKISRAGQMTLAFLSVFFLGINGVSKFADLMKNKENFNRVKKGFDFLRVNTLTKDFSGEKRANDLATHYLGERKIGNLYKEEGITPESRTSGPKYRKIDPINSREYSQPYATEIKKMLASKEATYIFAGATDKQTYNLFMRYIQTNPNALEKLKESKGSRDALLDVFGEWRIQKMDIAVKQDYTKELMTAWFQGDNAIEEILSMGGRFSTAKRDNIEFFLREWAKKERPGMNFPNSRAIRNVLPENEKKILEGYIVGDKPSDFMRELDTFRRSTENRKFSLGDIDAQSINQMVGIPRKIEVQQGKFISLEKTAETSDGTRMFTVRYNLSDPNQPAPRYDGLSTFTIDSKGQIRYDIPMNKSGDSTEMEGLLQNIFSRLSKEPAIISFDLAEVRPSVTTRALSSTIQAVTREKPVAHIRRAGLTEDGKAVYLFEVEGKTGIGTFKIKTWEEGGKNIVYVGDMQKKSKTGEPVAMKDLMPGVIPHIMTILRELPGGKPLEIQFCRTNQKTGVLGDMQKLTLEDALSHYTNPGMIQNTATRIINFLTR